VLIWASWWLPSAGMMILALDYSRGTALDLCQNLARDLRHIRARGADGSS
jgi:hypothetical protein